MLFLILILVIAFVAIIINAIKTANKEDVFDSICLYGKSITTKGSNSDYL